MECQFTFCQRVLAESMVMSALPQRCPRVPRELAVAHLPAQFLAKQHNDPCLAGLVPET